MSELLRDHSYSAIRDIVAALPIAPSDSVRDVQWLDSDSVIGVSRNKSGHMEIFISGSPLPSKIPSVGRSLIHDTWEDLNSVVPATRLQLPAEKHFDPVAAFVCANLIENGILQARDQAYLLSEPVIGLVLEEVRASAAHVVGLCGELLVLRSILTQFPGQTSTIVGSWHGQQHSARDFQFGGVGVEVKTTTGPTSRHHIHGTRQIEIGHAVGGGFESALFLASIGIAPADPNQVNAWSLPQLADEVLNLIGPERPDLADKFVAALRSYGDDSFAYEHGSPLHAAIYSASYSTAFARFYDLGDPAISILRAADLAQFQFVDSQSVQFSVEFPAQIHGSLNPTFGLTAGTNRIAKAAWNS